MTSFVKKLDPSTPWDELQNIEGERAKKLGDLATVHKHEVAITDQPFTAAVKTFFRQNVDRNAFEALVKSQHWAMMAIQTTQTLNKPRSGKDRMTEHPPIAALTFNYEDSPKLSFTFFDKKDQGDGLDSKLKDFKDSLGHFDINFTTSVNDEGKQVVTIDAAGNGFLHGLIRSEAGWRAQQAQAQVGGKKTLNARCQLADSLIPEIVADLFKAKGREQNPT